MRQVSDAGPVLQPQRWPRPDGGIPNSSQQDVRQDGREQPEGRPLPLRIRYLALGLDRVFFRDALGLRSTGLGVLRGGRTTTGSQGAGVPIGREF